MKLLLLTGAFAIPYPLQRIKLPCVITALEPFNNVKLGGKHFCCLRMLRSKRLVCSFLLSER